MGLFRLSKTCKSQTMYQQKMATYRRLQRYICRTLRGCSKKQFTSMKKNVDRSKCKNVRKCQKLSRNQSTSESQLKLQEKLPSGSALEHQTMSTHQKKSGKLILQAIDNFNQAKPL